MDYAYAIHGSFILLVLFTRGLKNIKNVGYWLGCVIVAFAMSYALYFMFYVGGFYLINLIFDLGSLEGQSTYWVSAYLFPIMTFMIWGASIPSCKSCKMTFSNMNVISEECISEKFDYEDSRGKPIVKYKHTKKDGSPDDRYKDDIETNQCNSVWQVKRECKMCKAITEEKESRVTPHTTHFTVSPKYL